MGVRSDRLGPYQILGPLGAGGMGEVYRARDTRLDREVAVKVLPKRLSQDREALTRFEREAKAVAALSHPNILAIYEFASHEGAVYAVMELLEGETLRDRVQAGALPLRKALDYAVQIAHGLAAAHERGIIHRDLKPSNLFLTRDGRAKILDFGLAKLAPDALSDEEKTGSLDATEPGTIMGTVGYMSPEQLRGQSTDHRSDIFSFGAILYEMVSGQRAFKGDSAADIMSAILKDDPPDLSDSLRVPTALDRVIHHCLEKSPEERFQSVRDLAFDLESLAGSSGAARVAAGRPWVVRGPRRGALVAAALLALGTVFVIGRATVEEPSQPAYKRVTFRRGDVDSARFAPDGQTVVYGALWDGNPIEVYSCRVDSPESRSLGLVQATVLAVSPTGEMALSLRHRAGAGTLARMSLAGGAPREVLEQVRAADWSPDGQQLAVVRLVGGRSSLEFPIGRVLFQSAGWITNPRVSPQGDLVAFIDHPVLGDTAGAVVVVDREGKSRTLSSAWASAGGLAWRPDAKEIWFTATKVGSARALQAVELAGRERVVTQVAGRLVLQDIARDGRVLLAHPNARSGIIGLMAGQERERDLSWLDYSRSADLSADGRMLLFDEGGDGAGGDYSTYLRRTDGSPAVRLGDGHALALSPDGEWVVSIVLSRSQQLLLLPTGPGEARPLPHPGMRHQSTALWLPDGRHILFAAREAGQPVRSYLQDVHGAQTPRPVTPEGIMAHAVSPDGRWLLGSGMDRRFALYALEGGPPRPIPGLGGGDIPIRWSGDVRFLYVFREGELPAKLTRLELASGAVAPWKQLMPSDPAGVTGVSRVQLTPDGASCTFTYRRTLTDLYLVEGLK